MWEQLIVHAFSLLTGGLGGGLLRLLPEGLNLIKQKMANGHELEMMDKQLKIQEAIGAEKLQEAQVVGAAQVETAQVAGAVETTKATGIRFLDVLNGSVRPVITYWTFALYALAKTIVVVVGFQAGSGAVALVPILWTAHDSAMLSGMLSFWFLGRVLDKQRNGG